MINSSNETPLLQSKLFHRGDDFFAELVGCIRRARVSITLEYYIFEMNQISDILLVELRQALGRGCKVRLLVDGVGSLFWLESLKKRCHLEGIEFRVYHPVPGIFQWITEISPVLRLVNRRNHRKTAIIDGQVALMGSFNISHVHSEKIMGPRAWRDSGVRLQSPAVASLIAAFEVAWSFSKNLPIKTPSDLQYLREKTRTILLWQRDIRLNINEKLRRFLYKDLCRRILQAEEKVYITTAYFLPKRAVAKALMRAAKKGTDVRVLIPGPSDVPLVKWVAFQLPRKLSKAGVKVYEYQPRVLHAKYMIIDHWSSIGSLNLNHRSLLHDLEGEAVFTDVQTLDNLNAQFLQDLSEARLLGGQGYEESTWWMNWLTKILFKLRYWL